MHYARTVGSSGASCPRCSRRPSAPSPCSPGMCAPAKGRSLWMTPWISRPSFLGSRNCNAIISPDSQSSSPVQNFVEPSLRKVETNRPWAAATPVLSHIVEGTDIALANLSLHMSSMLKDALPAASRLWWFYPFLSTPKPMVMQYRGGFWGPLYYIYDKEPSKIVYGYFFGPYMTQSKLLVIEVQRRLRPRSSLR